MSPSSIKIDQGVVKEPTIHINFTIIIPRSFLLCKTIINHPPVTIGFPWLPFPWVVGDIVLPTLVKHMSQKNILFSVNPGLINHGLLIRGLLLQ